MSDAITISLTRKSLLKAISLLEEHDDCGPVGESWKSDELEALIDELKQAADQSLEDDKVK